MWAWWLVGWPLLFLAFVGLIAWTTNRHERRHGISMFGGPRCGITPVGKFLRKQSRLRRLERRQRRI
jgi:hypothetical protein